MITATDITFAYNPTMQFAFPNISVGASQSLLITGGSGKGKTTLLHLLGGLLRPSSGEISINDVAISQLRERKLDHFRGQHIGLVLQQSYFVESLTALENVVLPSWLATGKKAIVKAKSLLDELGVGDQMHKLPTQLSIGQQQRVSIARALINQPSLLLADEPTSSLDDENAAVVAELLHTLTLEYNAALIVVTHDQRLKDRFENTLSL